MPLGVAELEQSCHDLTATWMLGSSADFDGAEGLDADETYRLARYTIVVDDVVDGDHPSCAEQNACDDCCEDCHVQLAVVPEGTGGLVHPVIGSIRGASAHRYGVQDEIQFSFDIVDVCGADVDNDNSVGVNDLVLVILDWGNSNVAADIDRSGIVGVVDLLSAILAWGDCPDLPASSCLAFEAPCQ